VARCIVAYGFYKPAMMKWNDIDSVAQWFASINIPFHTFSAYLAATAETLGVIFLVLGFLTRFVSIPLIIVMIVAIFKVHIGNGFSVADNGFEIPLYYMAFLMIFTTFGAGRFSIDKMIFKEKS
jgi:putative oxidoreductase